MLLARVALRRCNRKWRSLGRVRGSGGIDRHSRSLCKISNPGRISAKMKSRFGGSRFRSCDDGPLASGRDCE